MYVKRCSFSPATTTVVVVSGDRHSGCYLRWPPQWLLSPATATMAVVSGDRHSGRYLRRPPQWSHIQQSFHWPKVSPITHTLCCDKDSAEFNFTHHMRYPPRSSWWINRYIVHSVLIKSLLKKISPTTRIGVIGKNIEVHVHVYGS